MEEYRLRPQAINDSINYLSEFESTVLGLNKTHPWITVKQKMLTLGLILSAQHWLNNTIANQSNLSLTETPVLRVYELSNMLDVVAQNVTRLKNIKPSSEFYKVKK